MKSIFQTPERLQVNVVIEAVGHFTHQDGWSDGQCRLWLFEDRTAAVYNNGPDGRPIRTVIEFVQVIDRGTSLTFYIGDGRTASLVRKPCSCGFGAVAHAGPVDQRFAIKWIRPFPEWFTQR
jgi:hypothetical protein